jgi:hypothetical protein
MVMGEEDSILNSMKLNNEIVSFIVNIKALLFKGQIFYNC